jgi:hypothetical protein
MWERSISADGELTASELLHDNEADRSK